MIVTGAAGLAGCSGALNPAAQQANRINTLWWWLFAIACAVFVIVCGLLAWALFRPRNNPSLFERNPRSGIYFAIIGGGVIPTLILVGVFAYSLEVMTQTGADIPNQLVLNVTAYDWNYQVNYQRMNITTTGFMHIPTDRQVKLVLRSKDVIHSFWVPELNGKTDFIPGMTNSTFITATKAGTWTGHCAEFCGLGHTTMAITVTAESPAAFASWVASQQTH